jgi:hypothetical protein
VTSLGYQQPCRQLGCHAHCAWPYQFELSLCLVLSSIVCILFSCPTNLTWPCVLPHHLCLEPLDRSSLVSRCYKSVLPRNLPCRRHAHCALHPGGTPHFSLSGPHFGPLSFIGLYYLPTFALRSSFLTFHIYFIPPTLHSLYSILD